MIKLLRKIIAVLIGLPLLIVGLILIPLPGPGILICFLALFILSLEFAFIKPHFERSKHHLQKLNQAAKTQSKPKPKR